MLEVWQDNGTGCDYVESYDSVDAIVAGLAELCEPDDTCIYRVYRGDDSIGYVSNGKFYVWPN